MNNNKTPYDTIHSFCVTNKYPKIYEKMLLHKYYEDYFDLINSHNSVKEISEEEIRGINKTLLSETSLKTNISLSKDELDKYLEDKIKKFKIMFQLKDFIKSTLSSILGSILFTLLLVLFFYLAENQIRSWINSYNNQNNVEHSKK